MGTHDELVVFGSSFAAKRTVSAGPHGAAAACASRTTSGSLLVSWCHATSTCTCTCCRRAVVSTFASTVSTHVSRVICAVVTLVARGIHIRTKRTQVGSETMEGREGRLERRRRLHLEQWRRRASSRPSLAPEDPALPAARCTRPCALRALAAVQQRSRGHHRWSRSVGRP